MATPSPPGTSSTSTASSRRPGRLSASWGYARRFGATIGDGGVDSGAATVLTWPTVAGMECVLGAADRERGAPALAQVQRGPSGASRVHGDRRPRYRVLLRWRFRNRLSWRWIGRRECPAKARKSDAFRARVSLETARWKPLAPNARHAYRASLATPGPITRRPQQRTAIGRAIGHRCVSRHAARTSKCSASAISG